MPDISGNFHENPLTRFSIILLRIHEIEKSIIDLKGLTATSLKCSRLFLVSCSTFPENCMKIRSTVQMLLTDTDFLENIEKRKPIFKRLNITPQIFQLLPCIVPDLSWEFHENPFIRLSAMLLTDGQTYKWKRTRRGADLPIFTFWQVYWSDGSILWRNAWCRQMFMVTVLHVATKWDGYYLYSDFNLICDLMTLPFYLENQ